jgi:hypothetical protein
MALHPSPGSEQVYKGLLAFGITEPEGCHVDPPAVRRPAGPVADASRFCAGSQGGGLSPGRQGLLCANARRGASPDFGMRSHEGGQKRRSWSAWESATGPGKGANPQKGPFVAPSDLFGAPRSMMDGIRGNGAPGL